MFKIALCRFSSFEAFSDLGGSNLFCIMARGLCLQINCILLLFIECDILKWIGSYGNGAFNMLPNNPDFDLSSANDSNFGRERIRLVL